MEESRKENASAEGNNISGSPDRETESSGGLDSRKAEKPADGGTESSGGLDSRKAEKPADGGTESSGGLDSRKAEKPADGGTETASGFVREDRPDHPDGKEQDVVSGSRKVSRSHKRVHAILAFLGSMKFAIILLVILAAACAAGSFLTQGLTYEAYAERYSESAAHLIMLLGLDDVFHSTWFLILAALLCVSLLMCNILRMPLLVRQSRREFSPEAALKVADTIEREALPAQAAKDEDASGQTPQAGAMPGAAASGDGGAARHRTGRRQVACLRTSDENMVTELYRKALFTHERRGTDTHGRTYRYADRNKAGLWGPWITHLGILILIAGFGLGQMMKEEYTVYGLPGDSMAVGDTDYIVTIDDFTMDQDDQGTVTQYTSSLTVHDAADGTSRSAQTSVNHPASIYGLKYYQNSTGWAAHVVVKDNEEQIQEETMCIPGTISLAEHEDLHLSLIAFYPQYDPAAAANSTATTLPVTNPGWLYQVSARGQVIGMNVLCDDYISIDVADDQTLTIDIDDPQIYTLISIKKEPFTWLALVGGLVIMAGLVLSFYVQPAQIIALRAEDGLWHVYGWSRKGGLLYKQRLEETAEKCGR